MKIYLAGRYSRRDELAEYARELVLLGHHVTSRWLAGGPPAVTDAQLCDPGASLDALRLGQEYARRNVADVASADLLIGFTDGLPAPIVPGAVIGAIELAPYGGRQTEHGIAIALGKPCWIVGPRENVFHTLADGFFTDWRGVVHALGLLADSGLEPIAAGRWGWAAAPPEGART
jgi:hypothetical protein